jgi:Grx4 family monothiol glutaredoxin
MKGTPEQPRCRFSRRLVELLQEQNLPFRSYDVLTDPELRKALPKFSSWPTVPQLFVNGSFVGGLDVVQHIIEEDGGASFQKLVAPARARVAALQSAAAVPKTERPASPPAAFRLPAGSLHDFSELAISDGQSCQVEGSGCA